MNDNYDQQTIAFFTEDIVEINQKKGRGVGTNNGEQECMQSLKLIFLITVKTQTQTKKKNHKELKGAERSAASPLDVIV